MIDYSLTLLQFGASRFLIQNYNQKQDGIIIAVCGSGKTEMCFPVLSKAKELGRVGFAIPRIDICNEIYERLCHSFSPANVGIHTGQRQVGKQAPILVLTTNQLLKYKRAFTLVIIDEVDAFPFDIDPKFYNGVQQSVKDGCIFYLTSTPSQRLLSNNLPSFTIYKRWHNQPLPVPNLIYNKSIYSLRNKIKKIIRNRQRNLLIFISTITKGEKFSCYLNRLGVKHNFIYSTNHKRTELIAEFKAFNNKVLLTTTILERGVTFKDIDVLVIDSEDDFYNKAALVQIAGRVGRKIDFQQGKVYFCYSRYTTTIKQSVRFIKTNNRKI